jgi:hypothetical protein
MYFHYAAPIYLHELTCNRLWSSRMQHHSVLYTDTNISEEHASWGRVGLYMQVASNVVTDIHWRGSWNGPWTRSTGTANRKTVLFRATIISLSLSSSFSHKGNGTVRNHNYFQGSRGQDMGKEKTVLTEGLARGVSSQEEVIILPWDKIFFIPSGRECESWAPCLGNPFSLFMLLGQSSTSIT